MNHTAISVNYESVPKVRSAPADIHVNGLRARCYKCGEVRVKVVTSLHFGSIATGEKDVDGYLIYVPGSVKLCSLCNSVIQTAPPPPKPKEVTTEGNVNPQIYALLAHLIHGEREGWKLAKMLEVSQPTVWRYLWELQRAGLVTIPKEGKNASLKNVDVTDEGLHYFDVVKE